MPLYLFQFTWILANLCGVPWLAASIVVLAVWVIYASEYRK